MGGKETGWKCGMTESGHPGLSQLCPKAESPARVENLCPPLSPSQAQDGHMRGSGHPAWVGTLSANLFPRLAHFTLVCGVCICGTGYRHTRMWACAHVAAEITIHVLFQALSSLFLFFFTTVF